MLETQELPGATCMDPYRCSAPVTNGSRPALHDLDNDLSCKPHWMSLISVETPGYL